VKSKSGTPQIFVIAVGDVSPEFVHGLEAVIRTYAENTHIFAEAGLPARGIVREDLRQFVATNEGKGWSLSGSRADSAWDRLTDLPVRVWCSACRISGDKCVHRHSHEALWVVDFDSLLDIQEFSFQLIRNSETRALVQQFIQHLRDNPPQPS
jgi:hypothetical protein